MGQDLSSIALGKRDLETTQVAVVGSGVYSHEGAVPCSEKGLQFPPRTWGCRVDTVSDSKPLGQPDSNHGALNDRKPTVPLGMQRKGGEKPDNG